MFDFHEKRKIRNVIYSKFVIGLLCITTILLLFPVYKRYTVAQEMRMRFEEKESEYNMLRIRAEALESSVEYLRNDRGIEEELRNRFDVAREGEQVIILLDSPDSLKKP